MDTILCVHLFPSVPDLLHLPEMDFGVLLRGQHHLQLQMLNIATHCCCIKLVPAAELGGEPGENFPDEDHLGPQPFQLNNHEAQHGRHPTRLFPLIQLISRQLHNTHIQLCMLDSCQIEPDGLLAVPPALVNQWTSPSSRFRFMPLWNWVTNDMSPRQYESSNIATHVFLVAAHWGICSLADMLPMKVNVISISYSQSFYWSIDLLDRSSVEQEAADKRVLNGRPKGFLPACAGQPVGALHTNPGLHPAPNKLSCTVRHQY